MPQKNYKPVFMRNIYLLLILSLSISISIDAQDQLNEDSQFLPSGSEGTRPFGAYYTKLIYTPEWDKLWPVSEVTDVVVQFDDKEPRFIFWRGTSYIPCWATFKGAWFTNEFFERGGGAKSGTISMVEPMSDKLCRYSNIRIIESNEARVVIHWRYAPTDLEYNLAFVDKDTRWGDWADEIYVIYPDAVSIRKATLHTSALNEWIEYQESIVVNQPGTYPEDNINLDAVTLLNLKGENKTYTWTDKGGPGLINPPEGFCIQKVNFKSAYKPFTIVNPEVVSIDSYGGHAPGSHFNFWNHWPVSQAKSDTRVAESAIRPSHSSLSHIKWKAYSEDEDSRTWIMMHGMTNTENDQLVALAKSWIHPPQLKIIHGKFRNEGYDPSQRAYVISSPGIYETSSLKFELLTDEGSPVVNPAFLIKNWDKNDISVRINGKTICRGKDFRCSPISTVTGVDQIIWLKLNSLKIVTIEIK